MKIATRAGAVAAAAVLSLSLAACSASNEVAADDSSADAAATDTATDEATDAAMSFSGELNGSGASTQEKAMEVWRANFQTENPDLTINYDPVGSGGGRTAFLDGSVSWAGSDAALSEEDGEYDAAVDRCGDAGAVNLPMYISPIAVAFNLEGIDSLNMDAATIAAIFDGEITNWSDDAIASQNEGVELPDLAITMVHRSDESGTTKNFTDYLEQASDGAWGYEASGDWPNDLGESGQGTSGVVQIITSTEGTIGYADHSQTSGLGVVSVKVGDEYVAPSADGAALALTAATPAGVNGDDDLAYELDRTTTEAGAYPVIVLSYVIVCEQYDDADEAAKVTSFLEYTASQEGQAASVDAAGNAPLSSDLSDQVIAVLEGIAAASGV
ncbi:phosphate ABC transporter substrate-binding protein PstS [Demequina salsinemoris]|uniref:phosphate ABC transporter substrate-binding protein PstS n=1 Tax=Demequina salsinemoris TaxID=577470 RepID=UPI000781E74E|nr:phosphate ABC transporter substrate-binding protein PstS [Demequina salsinemoris]